jgi:hypothetical protein
MAIKAYTLAITIAVVGLLTVAITGASLAAPALSGASVPKAAVPIAATGRKVPKGRAAILELFRRLGLPKLTGRGTTQVSKYCYLPDEPCDNNHRVTN